MILINFWLEPRSCDELETVVHKSMKGLNGTDAELVEDERIRFAPVILRVTSPEQEGA